MKLTQKSASLDGKPLAPTDPQYLHADKWLPASRPGVVLRPAAKTAPAPAADANAAVVQEFGVFLKPEDLEEVFALARSGASLSIVN
jgi:hypothetical protein